jgi:hypothetical protein
MGIRKCSVEGTKGIVLTDCSELAREKMWARIHLIPALQAEEDRDQVRKYLADKAREKELLGSETRVYNSDRYGVNMGRRGDNQLTLWLQIRSTNLRDHARARDEIEKRIVGSTILSDWRVYIRTRGVQQAPASTAGYMQLRGSAINLTRFL